MAKKITVQTRLNMVIGYPLQHSQSPVLHNAVYRQLGLNVILLPQSHSSPAALCQAIRTLSVGLTAVTAPFKQAVMACLDSCSPEATRLGAVNTLILREGKLHGHNTDITGIAFAMRHLSLTGKTVLIAGAGGAARAAGQYVASQGGDLLWMNRTPAKAAGLAKTLGGVWIPWRDIRIQEADLVIHATPVGSFPHTDETPLPGHVFQPHQTVFDMVYHPVFTTLLKQAQKSGAAIINGMDMFVRQGLKQIELWLQKPFFDLQLAADLSKLLVKHQEIRTP